MKYEKTICIICGLSKGIYIDHSKCSEQLKIMKAGSGENKNPKKKLNKRNIEYLCRAGMF